MKHSEFVNQMLKKFDVYVKANELKITLVRTWKDDHITCCLLDIQPNDVSTELWWCGDDIVYAVKYASDSKIAYNDMIQMLRKEIKIQLSSTIDSLIHNDSDTTIPDKEWSLLSMIGITLKDLQSIN